MLDLAIIGSGPAALTAAIYAARAGLSVKIFEKSRFGGALPDISHLANFPGYDGSGAELANYMKKQAENVGVAFEYGEMTNLDSWSEKNLEFTIDNDAKIKTRAVLIATGSEPIPLNIQTSAPVSYCAACDGPLYKDKNLVVVGGGNSAVQEAISLARIAKHVTIITRGKFSAQQIIIDQLESLHNVSVKADTTPDSTLLNQFDGVFAFIGHRPATNFLPREILDKNGYIVTDNHQMTKIPGLFAAGDVRDNTVKQAITASGDGASAATFIAKYL